MKAKAVSPKSPKKRKPRKLREPWRESLESSKVEYVWYELLNGFRLVAPNLEANLIKQDNDWLIKLKIGNQPYSGTRPNIEDAFKAVDRLISKHSHDVWLHCNCRAVLKEFEGDLSNL